MPEGRSSIKELVFPRLFGDLADDFQEILVHTDGSFRNSAMNANNQRDKQYLLLYKGISIDLLHQIRFLYHAEGDDVLVRVHLDSLGGQVLLEADLKHTRGAPKFFASRAFDVKKGDGTHDLIFHFVNTSGKFNTGVAWFKEMELLFEDIRTDPILRAQQDSLLKIYRSGTRTPIMRSKSDLLRRKTNVLERGNYLVKGRKIGPGVPQIFNQAGQSITNRLELAQWLVNEENALTARVIVNRIWEMIFGHGLVMTLEDFGTQGTPATHPDLLNFLAYNFSHNWEWSVKRLLKEIVLSKTYQQAVHASAEKLKLDPYNRYYSRGSRIRLSAEQIRDQALAIGGLLSRRVGGPSVMPPQPEHVWQVVYSNAKWIEAKGEDRFRRGLYTYWKRTTPYPSMIAFDSPSREYCVSRRIRTNTPLQALITLNDTVYLEAAIGLARWMSKNSSSLEEAVKLGYKKALLAEPDEATVRVLTDLHANTTTSATKLVSNRSSAVPNLSIEPMVIVANAIMNLDAFLTKS